MDSHLKALILATSVCASATAVAQHQTSTLDEPAVGGTLPYSIAIREVSFAPAEVPNIHSAAAAIWEGQWVILAGRTNGLHGMTGRNAFEPVYENRDVWVIDPQTNQSWHKSLESSSASGLSQDEVDSLSSVNTEFYQTGETLLVVGGYGYQRSASDHVTYDRISAIELPGMVDWVKSPAGSETTQAADHVHQVIDTYFQVTGGGLELIGDEFQLVFGQNYPGRYRPNFSGTYTQSIRRFEVSGSGSPFTNQSGVVVRHSDGSFEQYLLPGIELQLPGELAHAYLLESSSDLGDWAPASLPKVGDGSPLSWSLEADAETYFYRVIHGIISHP